MPLRCGLKGWGRMPDIKCSRRKRSKNSKGRYGAVRFPLHGAAALIILTVLFTAGCGGFLSELADSIGLQNGSGVSGPEDPADGNGAPGDPEDSESAVPGDPADAGGGPVPAPGNADEYGNDSPARPPDEPGDSDDLLYPPSGEPPLTRGQYIKLLLEYVGYDPPAGGDMPFTDAGEIPEGERDYVAGAWSMGLIKPLPDGRFAADEPLRREDMGLIITRLIGLSTEGDQLYTIYTDDDELGVTEHSVRYSVEKRIMGGIDPGRPEHIPDSEHTFSREEALRILDLFDRINWEYYFGS